MKSPQIRLSIFIVLAVLVLIGYDSASAQVKYPRASQRATVSQTIGMTDISIVYHRPLSKGRTIWGCTAPPEDLVPSGSKTYPCLVPYNQVWRMGANEATTFEVSDDVMINGQKLPKGKYSIHAIPGATEWTIIFSKNWNQWGSFSYKEAEDALRVKVKPETADMHDALIYDFEDVSENKTVVELKWEKIRVPITVEVSDPNAAAIRQALNDATGSLNSAASYIIQNKLKDRYPDAMRMLDASLATREAYNTLSLKARLNAEMGNFKEAVTIGEKAIQVGKAAQANTANFERLVADWKTKTQ